LLLETVILVMLAIAVAGTLPMWPHSRDWGYGPAALITVVMIVLLVLALKAPVGI
jgi:hypothetical protein